MAGLVLRQLLDGRSGSQQGGAFTLRLLGTGLAFTLFTLRLPTLLLLAVGGGLPLALFTLGLLLFTLAFTALTGFPLGAFTGLRPLLLLPANPLLPLGFLTGEAGFVFTLFTGEGR
ncbi:hypothetical protein GPJ59_36025, partial [Streptomyces bambusae]|nr:hypothetical protein [Streptomyces bambusae]